MLMAVLRLVCAGTVDLIVLKEILIFGTQFVLSFICGKTTIWKIIKGIIMALDH